MNFGFVNNEGSAGWGWGFYKDVVRHAKRNDSAKN